MAGTSSGSTQGSQIQAEKMKLAVSNVYPAFPQKSEKEARQEISTRLYGIFKKYASDGPGGRH